jgi:biotin carboxyl carrier protein
MKYHVSLDGREYEVEVDGDAIRIGGRLMRASLQAVPGTPMRLLTLDGQSVGFAVTAEGTGRWILQHHGEAVAVEVLDERTRHIRNMVGAGKAQQSGAVVKAPMPGLVVRVLAEPGAPVVHGAGLVILEAMKMENELKAPVDGVVAQVQVRPGQSVEKGQVLVVLE